MEKGFVENGFIIDLSSTMNTTQLVFELSSIMEHPDVKGKRICLKLGSLDLKQSQLLSIKALIESMDASIAFIDTASEQTEASAVSLGIIVSKVGENSNMEAYVASPNDLKEESVAIKEEISEEESQDIEETEETKTVEVHADITPSQPEEPAEPISTLDGIEDVYTEQTTDELSEVIPAENFETDFETLAVNEGLISNEEVSKYILLDTGDVLPQDTEENLVDTKTLPTLYINQTLRSGQTVTYEGNILIIGDAHPGSEIIADGDITVWGILGGIAHAGCNGNTKARIRALTLNAIQLRIADSYARRPDHIKNIYVEKSNTFTPEEARNVNGSIVILKINDR